MKRNLFITVAAAVVAAGAMVALPSVSAAQAPPMGGGYTNVIPIPVNDPSVKAIAGALFKPEGTGPFPAVVYMSGCAGLNDPAEIEQEKVVVDGLLANGMATLIVDPFTPRGEMEGICAKLDRNTFVQYATRGGDDAVAALKVVKAMPDIDPNRVFLQGYSFGAISSLFATDTRTPGTHDTKIAGLIAYYPYCYDNVDPAVPTLVLIGEKDDWTSAAACQAIKDKPNVEVVVYAGATHGFTTPIDKPATYLGHHIVYDEEATEDAQDRADAFIAAHMK
jgi:dienelactone hydrolase